LSWVDLNRWAGGKIVGRGRGYQNDGAVEDLARAPGGGLIAWVDGTRRYAVHVERDSQGGLLSACTCPYEGTCKHAVAVVLEYLQCLEKGTPVPLARKDDKRFDEFEIDSDEDDDEDDEFDREEEERPARGRGGGFDSFIEGMSREELVRLVRGMSERHQQVREELEDRKAVSQGNTGTLVRSVRRKIREAAAEPGWCNRWDRYGDVADYSGIQSGLAALLEAGCADEVLGLAEELLEAATLQAEESSDEGDTGRDVAGCAAVVAKALERSPRPIAEKILWTLEMLDRDSHDQFFPLEKFLERRHAKKHWGEAADVLLKRLEAFKPSRPGDEWLSDSERDRLTDTVILALENSGRQGEIIPLCEREAKKTGRWDRLVKRLIDAARLDEAEAAVFEGLKAAEGKRGGNEWTLRGQLLQIRIKRGDHLGEASLRVDEFLRRPSQEACEECRKATRPGNLWPRVRQGLMRFLESGAFPWDEKDWPLPDTGLTPPAAPRGRELPMRYVLIDIATHEKQPDQVLRWYDMKPEDYVGADRMDRVATAVMEYAPDRSVGLWKKLAEWEISKVQPSAYEAAAGYLWKLSGLLTKLGREAEWKDYLAGLRAAHARKRRLMETLGTLEGGPIVKPGRR